jgi:hypothetical protein
MCRIGGRLRSCVARRRLVTVEIPPFAYLESNSAMRTVLDG